MSRGVKHSRDWQERDRVDRINASRRRQTDRIQALLSARRSAAEAPPRMLRPGISVPTTVHYASTSAPLDWALADRGRPIIDAILDSVEDGNDRVILAWPGRPGNGFAAAAIALREARATGRLADATLALWPWRNGATWSARSILVHPEDIAQIGARAADEIMHGAFQLAKRSSGALTQSQITNPAVQFVIAKGRGATPKTPSRYQAFRLRLEAISVAVASGLFRPWPDTGNSRLR